LEDRQKLRDLFAAADTDGNGSISLDEFKTFQSRRESRAKEKRGDQAAADRPAKQHSPEDMFARLDTDKNGVLSRAELEAGRDRAQQRQKGDRPERPAEKRIRPGQ
jgi:Ca2+-binding EF-hand superfamily protein